MDTATVAREFTDMCANGELTEAGEAFWAEDVVSLEPVPGEMARVEGREAVARKGEWWVANHEVHSVEVEGPFVFEDQFAVRFSMDVTPKDGDRMQMDEVALYTVRDGKIVEERFLYGAE